MLAGSSAPLLQLAEQIARTHHERWDGSGYPSGLRGEQIPLAGRICAVADVFDALVSPRPYKRAWTLAEAVAELRAQRGRDFDPELVDAFLSFAPAAYAELYGAFAPEPAPARDTAPAGDPSPPHRSAAPLRTPHLGGG
jgi:response regulator RpfG family c-di-GMP phosphodiesterase